MVTNENLIKELSANFEDRLQIVEKKNSNYAGGGKDGNAFKNFDLIETITSGKVSREIGMLVRMTDKLARLGTLLTGGEDAVGESTEDTLQDLANYADLTLVAVRDKRETKACYPEAEALANAEQLDLPFDNIASSTDDDLGNTHGPIGNASPLRRHARLVPVETTDERGNITTQFIRDPTEDESPKSTLLRFLSKLAA